MKLLDTSSKFTQIMGVLNTTPDSFSDGGCFYSLEDALIQAKKICDEGADIIDIGGESTRPGAPAVSVDEELARVIPLMEAIVSDPDIDIPMSVDTSKAEVMSTAIKAGATFINDVNALSGVGALKVCADAGVQVCLMHMQGQPRTMQFAPHYDDVVDSVIEFLHSRAQYCLKFGILRENIIIDPGFGFGKTLEHNLALMRSLGRICDGGFNVLVGISRKSMIGSMLELPVDDRLYGSLAAASYAAQIGVKIIRVHDVLASRQVVDVIDIINQRTN